MYGAAVSSDDFSVTSLDCVVLTNVDSAGSSPGCDRQLLVSARTGIRLA